MAEFVLDTGDKAREFASLDSFTQGYIEALFFTESGCFDKSEIDSAEAQESIAEGTADGELPSDSGFADLSPAALASILEDCEAFQNKARDLLAAAYARDYETEQAGRDFWFTRNRHGVGFWDRQELESGNLGNMLSHIAKGFGEVNCYWHDSLVGVD